MFASHLKGRRILPVIPLIPVVQYLGWVRPADLMAINAGCGIVVTSLAGVLTIAGGVLIIDFVAQVMDRRTARTGQDARRSNGNEIPAKALLSMVRRFRALSARLIGHWVGRSINVVMTMIASL